MNSLSPFLLNDQVFNTIKEGILENKFTPNQKLIESEISRTLGVSRGPIREALQRLCIEGLVRLVPNKGAYVISYSLKDTLDLYEIRENFEIIAVRLSIERADESDLCRISDQIKTIDQRIKNNGNTSFPWDSDFHIKIAECTKNRYIVEHISKLNTQMHLIRYKSAKREGRAERALREHTEIYKALCERNLKKMEQLMVDHIRASKDNLIRLYYGEAALSNDGSIGQKEVMSL
jgi:DNA-binding GntR family transcriptional regulator